MKTLMIMAILLCSFGIAEGQLDRPDNAGAEQVVSSHMFDRGMQRFSRPPSEWQGKARRITKSHISDYGDGKPLGRVTEILEFDAAGSFRRHITVDSPYQRSVQEMIGVGHFLFTRVNGGPWQRKGVELFGLAVPPGAPFETRRTDAAGTFKFYKPGATFEFKIGTGVFRGEMLLVYIRTIVSSEPGKQTGSLVEQEQTNRYWLADNGRMVKYEDLKINRKTGAGTHLTEEYELDPSIRIEAPTSMQ